MEASKFDVFFMKNCVSGEFLIKNKWNFVRLGWKKHQNLALGVIYRSVPSESQKFKQIIAKTSKTHFINMHSKISFFIFCIFLFSVSRNFYFFSKNQKNLHKYIYIYVCIYIWIHVYMYIYTYIHTNKKIKKIK